MDLDMWQEVEDFLVDSGSLSSEWRGGVPFSGSIWLQLADALRDGRVLCTLINNLKPGAIDDDRIVSGDNLNDRECKCNIKLFLSTCRQYFRLDEADVFEPEDLLSYVNFGKVFVTLSVLSNSEEAINQALVPFPTESSLTSFLEDRQQQDADGEEILEDIYANVDRELYRDAFRLSTLDNENFHGEVGDIYDTLCSYERAEAKAPPLPPGVAEAVGDLIVNENSYICTLRRIHESFVLPLTNFLSVERRHIIFLEIENFAKIHSRFYDSLIEACTLQTGRGASGGTSCIRVIGEAFMRMKGEFARAYGSYVNNLSRAGDLLEQICESDPTLQEQVLKCEKEARDGYTPLKLRILIPICRFLKMASMFENILKTIDPADTEDRADFEIAHDSLKKLNTYLDLIKEESDELRAGKILKEQLIFSDVVKEEEMQSITYRLFLKGEILVTEKFKKPCNKVVFVLGSCILICNPNQGNSYQCLEFISLEGKRAEAGSKTDRIWLLVDEHTGSVHRDFFCPDKAMADKMMKAVDRAIQWMTGRVQFSFLRVKKHAFLGTDLGPGMHCQLCDDLIPGIAGRALECSHCGLQCHFACGISDLPDCDGEQTATEKPYHDVPATVLDDVRRKLWFKGDFMQREDVCKVMERPFVPVGTFLARFPENRGGVAFSIKDPTGRLRHLRLAVVRHKNGGKRGIAERSFCWSRDVAGFASVDHLVKWCQNNSLKFFFSNLDFSFGLPLTMIMTGHGSIASNLNLLAS